MNQQAFYNQQPVEATKSSKDIKMKDSKANKLKARSQPSVLQQLYKTFNKIRKEKKKDHYNQN